MPRSNLFPDGVRGGRLKSPVVGRLKSPVVTAPRATGWSTRAAQAARTVYGGGPCGECRRWVDYHFGHAMWCPAMAPRVTTPAPTIRSEVVGLRTDLADRIEQLQARLKQEILVALSVPSNMLGITRAEATMEEMSQLRAASRQDRLTEVVWDKIACEAFNCGKAHRIANRPPAPEPAQVRRF